MKLYVVTQEMYCEGNFGDLESAGTRTVGIFSSRALAKKAADSIEQPTFYAQFGDAEQPCKISEMILNEVPFLPPLSSNIY